MTHPLAVYTVIYIAILFVTVSIWGSDIADVTGDTRVLLFTLGAFSIKLAIDDYVHFQSARRDLLHVDLWLSLLMYLLLAASIAHSAIGRTHIAALLFAAVFLLGIAWIVYSGLSGSGWRIDWLIVNTLAIGLLGWAAALESGPAYTDASIPLTLLFVLVVADFVAFGTLRRLADIGDKPAAATPQRPALDADTNARPASPDPAVTANTVVTPQPSTNEADGGQEAGEHAAAGAARPGESKVDRERQ